VVLPVEFKTQGHVYCLRHFRPFVMEVRVPAADARVYRVRVTFVTSHGFTRQREDGDTPDLWVDAFGDPRTFCPERYARSKNIREVFVWASNGRAFFSDERRAKARRFLIVKGEQGLDPLVIPFEAEKARSKKFDVVLNVMTAYPAKHAVRLSQSIHFPKLIQITARGEIASRPNPHGSRGPGGRRR
jgi:hypothetical protein